MGCRRGLLREQIMFARFLTAGDDRFISGVFEALLGENVNTQMLDHVIKIRVTAARNSNLTPNAIGYQGFRKVDMCYDGYNQVTGDACCNNTGWQAGGCN